MTFALNYTLSLRQVKADAVFWPVPVMENQFGSGATGLLLQALAHLRFHRQRGQRPPRPDHGAVQLDGRRRRQVITNWGNEGEHWHRVNGEIEALPEVLDTYRGASDPQRAMRAALGTGLLQFALIVDQKPIYYYDPLEVSDWYAQINSDPNMILPVLSAALVNEADIRAPEALAEFTDVRQHPQPGARRVASVGISP